MLVRVYRESHGDEALVFDLHFLPYSYVIFEWSHVACDLTFVLERYLELLWEL